MGFDKNEATVLLYQQNLQNAKLEKTHLTADCPFCREKGLCALCKSDLSAIFHTHGKLAIDHIVPIAKFP